MGRIEEKVEPLPLFETKLAKGRVVYKAFTVTIFICICLIWVYRVVNIPATGDFRMWAWIGMFLAELWFGFYWIITQSVRWNITYRVPHKDRLLLRKKDEFPSVDIFVCTADPTIEPPSLVMSTVLSAMSYNYPPDKLSIYLSDDGGSVITFYALLEASKFAKHWIPFCNKFGVEPRSPSAYFSQSLAPRDSNFARELSVIKKLYEEMKNRIDVAIQNGTIPQEIRDQHKGFSEWSLSKVSKYDHQSIVQILIDGRDPKAVDDDGHKLPTLVYLAREKRPNFPHNFKAGAMNALIRVSSEISNGAIILNSDCDMYSNDPDAILEALCFFMDEKQGHKISYVQHPQCYTNNSKNDIYSSISNTINKIELSGIDGFDGALYCGTGCFHRRVSLCGHKYFPSYKEELDATNERSDANVHLLEERSKILASCSFEDGTQWGKEMGLVYGCPVEDIVTGLIIQCKGWKPIYYNPKKTAFLGVGPITLEQGLVQYKRWCEGLFQIFVSKYCPFIYGHGKIKLGAQMGYCVYLLWAPNSFPTLYYILVPSLCLLPGLPLFPEASSLWFLPFAYVFISRIGGSLVEALVCGDTFKGWWNSQRMWLIRRITAFFFAFFDTISRQLGFSETTFIITSKVADDDVSKMYEKELFDFGSSSIMFTTIATLALVNLFSLIGFITKMITRNEFVGSLLAQCVLCWVVVMINLPVYEGLFFRSDKGRFPFSVVISSFVISSIACLIFVF